MIVAYYRSLDGRSVGSAHIYGNLYKDAQMEKI